jgi:hypothetical protein
VNCWIGFRCQVSAPPLANLKYFFAPRRAKKKRLGEEGFFTRRLVQTCPESFEGMTKNSHRLLCYTD